MVEGWRWRWGGGVEYAYRDGCVLTAARSRDVRRVVGNRFIISFLLLRPRKAYALVRYRISFDDLAPIRLFEH